MAELGKLKKLFHQWGGTTATFFSCIHLSHDLSIGLLVAILPFIREDLGLNYLQSGLLVSVFTIALGLSQFPGGWLGGRLGQRMVMSAGLFGVGLAGLTLGFSPNYYFVLSGLAIMGVFAGAYHPLSNTMLPGYFERSRRGKVVALHGIGGNIGFTISPFLGGLLAGTLGWRFAYIVLSFPALVAAVLVLKQLRQQEPVNHDGLIDRISTTGDTLVKQASRRPGIIQALRAVAAVSILAIIVHFIAGTATAYIPIYLVDMHNVTPFYAAMLVGILRGGAIIGSLFGGWLSDKWGRREALFLVLITIGPVLYLLAILPFGILLIVIFFVFGLLRQMRQITTLPLVMDSTPAQFRATVFGIYFGLSMEGTSLLQPVAGHFMDIYGIGDVFNIIALIGVALSLVALISVIRSRIR
ncbi:MFS transporter [Chloroflexota bacterium]